MVLPLKLCTPKGYNGFGATMQDNLQYDDETIAATLKVKHISVHSMPQVSKVGRSNHVIVQDEVGGCACISAIPKKNEFSFGISLDLHYLCSQNQTCKDYDNSRVECADMARHGRDSRQPLLKFSFCRSTACPAVANNHKSAATQATTRLNLFSKDIVITHQISIVLCHERMERSGDGLRMIEEIVDQLRNGIGTDAIEIEIARNRTNFFCYHGKGCAGKLGAFARDSDIIRKHDATVGLLETDIPVLAEKQDATAILTRQQGGIHPAAITLEIEVILLQRPKTIAACTEPSRIGWHQPLAYPLHAVYPLVEQEGNAEF